MSNKKCPICEKYIFTEEGIYEECPICGWTDDFYQEDFPDATGCANLMSLNEAKAAWAEGLPIY